jgi:hypothetical protein
VINTEPGESESWRRRVERAKQDIVEHKKELKVKRMAETVSAKVLMAFFEGLRNE